MPHYMHKTTMSQFIFCFLLILIWPIPIALASVFYIQKLRLQERLDAIKKIIEEFDEAESNRNYK